LSQYSEHFFRGREIIYFPQGGEIALARGIPRGRGVTVVEKQTESTKPEGNKTIVVKKWYWYIGLILVIYLMTIGLFQFWFRLPEMIFQDPPSGIGYTIGVVGMLVFGIWLMKKGRKVVDKPND